MNEGQQKALIVIPSRLGSTRYPKKPRVSILGKSLLERVWRIAKACKEADDVLIATPDEGLAEYAASFGGRAILTSGKGTGTDAVAEAFSQLDENHDVIVNLQGDAVLTPPWIIDDVIRVMREEKDVPLATPVEKLMGEAKKAFVAYKQAGSTSGTTAVVGPNGFALYFSKGVVPFEREPDPERPLLHHIGLYAYRPDTLARLASLEPTPLEEAEKLEQLRALEHGIPIRVVEVDYRGRSHFSVDHPEDVGVVEEIIAKEGELLP